MPRRARFVLPGTPHHVTQRGNRRQNVFFSDRDRSRYLELIREHSLRHELRILAEETGGRLTRSPDLRPPDLRPSPTPVLPAQAPALSQQRTRHLSFR